MTFTTDMEKQGIVLEKVKFKKNVTCLTFNHTVMTFNNPVKEGF